MENLFFFPLTLSAQPILPFFFFSLSAAQKTPRQPVSRRPVSLAPAISRPSQRRPFLSFSLSDAGDPPVIPELGTGRDSPRVRAPPAPRRGLRGPHAKGPCAPINSGSPCLLEAQPEAAAFYCAPIPYPRRLVKLSEPAAAATPFHCFPSMSSPPSSFTSRF